MLTWRSTPWPTLRRPPNRAAAAILLAASLGRGAWPAPACAQQLVFDPRNYAESALHTAHELQSLTNEAQMLANQARALAASPYSHLAAMNRTLGDIAALAQAVRGIAVREAALEGQFQSLYPTAVAGLDPRSLAQQAQSRTTAASQTAQDLARTAAALEQLNEGHAGRIGGALAAAQGAKGPTAAMQASAQLLGALSEDLGALRETALAQSRLFAETAASRAADAAAGAEIHRRQWAHEAAPPPDPGFDPFPNARN